MAGTAAHAAHRTQVPSGVFGISHAPRAVTTTATSSSGNTGRPFAAVRGTSATSAVGVPHL